MSLIEAIDGTLVESLRLRREGPGSYAATVRVAFDGEKRSVSVWVTRQEKHDRGHVPGWTWTVEAPAGKVIGGDDLYRTKKDAVLALTSVIDGGGFRQSKWGWVLV